MALRIVLALLLLTACGGAAQETTPRPAGEAPSATMVPRGPEPKHLTISLPPLLPGVESVPNFQVPA